jgi:hypothetical protein
MSVAPVIAVVTLTGACTYITRWYHQTHQTLLQQQHTMNRQKNHIEGLEEELLRLRLEMRICALYDIQETDVGSK